MGFSKLNKNIFNGLSKTSLWALSFLQKGGMYLLYYAQHEKDKSNPWREINSISRKLKFFAVLILLWTALDVVFIIVWYFNTLELPLLEALIWMLPAFIFTIIFFRHRRRGNILYRRFNQEVAERLQAGKSIQIPKDKSLSLKNYLLLSELRFLKAIMICFGIAFAFILAPNEIVLIFKSGPGPVSKALNASIERKETLLKYLENSLAQSKQSYTILERSNKDYLKKNDDLQRSMWKHYSSIYEVQQYRARVTQIRNIYAQGVSPAYVDNLLRTERNVMDEIIGYIKVKLSFMGDDIVKAEQLVRQSEPVVSFSGALINHYDEILYDAQNSSYRDYLEIQQSNNQIGKNKKAMDKIRQAILNDSLTILRFRQYIQADEEMKKQVK